MKVEQTGCPEKSAYKIQTSENYPEESILHSEHGESWNQEGLILFVFFHSEWMNIIETVPVFLQFYHTEWKPTEYDVLRFHAIY
jgi:hypothetical protein